MEQIQLGKLKLLLHQSQLLLNAWKYLKEDGLLICDDFIWGDNKNIINNPCFAINQFFKDIKGFYKLEKVSNSQIFIKKMSYYK